MSKCPVCNIEFGQETNENGYTRQPFDQTRHHYHLHLLEDIAQKRSAKQESDHTPGERSGV